MLPATLNSPMSASEFAATFGVQAAVRDLSREVGDEERHMESAREEAEIR